MAIDRPMYRLVIKIYSVLPERFRDRLAHLFSPSFYVGTSAFVTRDDGRVLLVTHSYKPDWGTPGGLINRGEGGEACAIRETLEEVGIEIEPVGEPAVVIDPAERRVEYVVRARPAEGVDPDAATPVSPEITAAQWFWPDNLPELQPHAAESLVALLRMEMRSGPHPS